MGVKCFNFIVIYLLYFFLHICEKSFLLKVQGRIIIKILFHNAQIKQHIIYEKHSCFFGVTGKLIILSSFSWVGRAVLISAEVTAGITSSAIDITGGLEGTAIGRTSRSCKETSRILQ